MKDTIEEKLPEPVLHEFSFSNGISLTPDEMKTMERYGFLFSNGMILTPHEMKIMESFRVIHSAKIET